MESTRPVNPLEPLAPYIGGKRNLARRIVSRLEQIPHNVYAEPFVGMAGVFLRRQRAPQVEVINDYNRDVALFFRVLQRHYVAFLEMMRFQITTRVEFDRLALTDPETLTDLERAARFFYLQRTAFAGKVAGRTFGVSSRSSARFNITRLEPLLEEVHSRLASVTIECLDFREFFDRYDGTDTLFYCDPPYYGTESYYGRSLFRRSDFTALRHRLQRMKATFVLSVNDAPETRRLFDGFEIETVETVYSARDQGENPKVNELIVSNLPGGTVHLGELSF